MKLIIERPRRHRRIDLLRLLWLFVLLTMPLSVLYQISVHYLGVSPTAVVLADLPKLPRHALR